MERRIKPLMLKDFLMQDFSSCSSNGFKSFPRRQCCTSGPLFLLDKDHNNNLKKNPTMKNTSSSKKFHQRSRSKAASSKISAFQAVINAVKNLPFSSAVKSPSLQGNKSFTLPRSFSRKLFRKSFRKKGEAVREKRKPLCFDFATVVTVAEAAASTETATVSGGTSKSENWSDVSECTSANSESCSGESSNISGKDQVFLDCKKESLNEKVSNSDPTPTTKPTCLIEEKTEKQWRIDEDKEQFSPVSILDCPFQDEDETCSPFRSRLTQFKPVDLQKRLALSESDGDETSNSSEQSTPTLEENEDEEDGADEQEDEGEAQNLLKLITANSVKFKLDDVLILDFFMEKLEGKQDKMVKEGDELSKKLIKVVEDYISGNQNETLVDWKVENNRKEYVKYMEEDGTWKKFDGEKEEVIVEVEVGIWNNLVDELLLDLF